MRHSAIILGIIAATFLVPQSAFARGGKQESRPDRREPKVEVVTTPVVVTDHHRTSVAGRPVVGRPVVVAPVVIERARPKTVVVEHVARPAHQPARHDVRQERRRPHGESHDPVRRGPRHAGHRHHAHCGWIAGHYVSRSREVVVPGYFRKEYVAAKYVQHQGPRGTCVIVQVHPAGWRNVWVPPSTTVRTEQVWVEGHYTCDR